MVAELSLSPPHDDSSAVHYVAFDYPAPPPVAFSPPLPAPPPTPTATRSCFHRMLDYEDGVQLMFTTIALLLALTTPLFIASFDRLSSSPSQPRTPHTLTLTLFSLCIDTHVNATTTTCIPIYQASDVSFLLSGSLLLAIRYLCLLGLAFTLPNLLLLTVMCWCPKLYTWRVYYAHIACAVLMVVSVFTCSVLCWCLPNTVAWRWVRDGGVEVRSSGRFNVGGYCLLISLVFSMTSVALSHLVRGISWWQWQQKEQRRAGRQQKAGCRTAKQRRRRAARRVLAQAEALAQTV